MFVPYFQLRKIMNLEQTWKKFYKLHVILSHFSRVIVSARTSFFEACGTTRSIEKHTHTKKESLSEKKSNLLSHSVKKAISPIDSVQEYRSIKEHRETQLK